MSNHLGNVLTSISDKKIGHNNGAGGFDYYNAEVVSATDYYAFGMRSRYDYEDPIQLDYRYGFNGKENDNEVKGGGDQIAFENRGYDPRLGRWYSTDGVTKPGFSPYNFAANNPVNNIDPDGKDEIHFHFYTNSTKGPDGKVMFSPMTARIEIIKANGPDRFFHHTHSTEVRLPTSFSRGGVSTFEKTKEFYPWKPDSRSGFTQSTILGLVDVNDRDYATLIKYASASPALRDYMKRRISGKESSYFDGGKYKGLLEDIPAYSTIGKIKAGAELAAGELSVVEGVWR